MMFWIAVSIFFVAYAFIVSDRIHRTTVVLSGAALMIVLGVLTQQEAFTAIDLNTIGLLAGMMTIVVITKQTGLFQYVAIQAAKAAKGEPVRILLYLSVITALFSAVLDNVTTILLIAPVTFVIAENLKVRPTPFIISEIIMANLGGAATLIGDPVNILVGSAANLTFADFLKNLTPIVFILIPIVLVILRIFYGKHLNTTEENKARIMQFNARESIVNKALLVKCLVVLGITILGFIFHGVLHLQPATIALFGAGLLLVITDMHPEEVLKELEWTAILFFAGLFMLVAGIEHVGFIDLLATELLQATGGSEFMTTFAVFWGSAILSGLVDNVPFVATMIPLIEELGVQGVHTGPLWWSLALGAVLGGNTTIIAASSNVVCSGIAEKAGYKISFKEFFQAGIVVMIVTVAISSLYIWLRYL